MRGNKKRKGGGCGRQGRAKVPVNKIYQVLLRLSSILNNNRGLR